LLLLLIKFALAKKKIMKSSFDKYLKFNEA
jgi:hypothetical protein